MARLRERIDARDNAELLEFAAPQFLGDVEQADDLLKELGVRRMFDRVRDNDEDLEVCEDEDDYGEAGGIDYCGPCATTSAGAPGNQVQNQQASASSQPQDA